MDEPARRHMCAAASRADAAPLAPDSDSAAPPSPNRPLCRACRDVPDAALCVRIDEDGRRSTAQPPRRERARYRVRGRRGRRAPRRGAGFPDLVTRAEPLSLSLSLAGAVQPAWLSLFLSISRRGVARRLPARLPPLREGIPRRARRRRRSALRHVHVPAAPAALALRAVRPRRRGEGPVAPPALAPHPAPPPLDRHAPHGGPGAPRRARLAPRGAVPRLVARGALPYGIP